VGGGKTLWGVFLKDSTHSANFPNRILNNKKDFENGLINGGPEVLNASDICQNEKKLQTIARIVSEQVLIK
jgi:hypothetical protein